MVTLPFGLLAAKPGRREPIMTVPALTGPKVLLPSDGTRLQRSPTLTSPGGWHIQAGGRAGHQSKQLEDVSPFSMYAFEQK